MLSIVNVVGSTIARISDDVIYTWAGPEIAVATTKGYTTQVSVLYLLALYLGEKRGCLSREEAAKLTDDLMILPQMVQRAIDLNPQIAQLAERYKNNPSLFFIGRNVDYAVCMEGSFEAQGDLLPALRGLCRGRAQAWHDLSDRAGHLRCCPCLLRTGF